MLLKTNEANAVWVNKFTLLTRRMASSLCFDETHVLYIYLNKRLYVRPVPIMGFTIYRDSQNISAMSNTKYHERNKGRRKTLVLTHQRTYRLRYDYAIHESALMSHLHETHPSLMEKVPSQRLGHEDNTPHRKAILFMDLWVKNNP